MEIYTVRIITETGMVYASTPTLQLPGQVGGPPASPCTRKALTLRCADVAMRSCCNAARTLLHMSRAQD